MDKLPMASRAATYAAVTFWRSGIFCDHSGILCDQAAGSLPGKPYALSDESDIVWFRRRRRGFEKGLHGFVEQKTSPSFLSVT